MIDALIEVESLMANVDCRFIQTLKDRGGGGLSAVFNLCGTAPPMRTKLHKTFLFFEKTSQIFSTIITINNYITCPLEGLST
jgi:hypothetical protein